MGPGKPLLKGRLSTVEDLVQLT